MSEPSLFVHDDLYDSHKKIETFKYCCPIFITGTFGTALAKDDDLICATNAAPAIRSGTLTFVAHEGVTYGITCRHVVEALETLNRANLEKWTRLVGQGAKYPPQAQLHFYFPTGNRQIHINAHFHKAPGDAFTNSYPDLAIAHIPTGTFRAIGRTAIAIGEDPSAVIIGSPHTCGIATGYPEQNRISRDVNLRLRTLAVSTVIAVAPFERFSDSQLRLFAELTTEPGADNLSGMSGGPIFWSHEQAWGLAGIVTEGRDMKAKQVNGNASIVDGHAIWIDGERLSRSYLATWIDSIPKVEEPIPNCSKFLCGPGIAQNA